MTFTRARVDGRDHQAAPGAHPRPARLRRRRPADGARLRRRSSTPAPMRAGGRRWRTGCRCTRPAPTGCRRVGRGRGRCTPTARSSGAFRGFGVPQAAIAQETLIDRLADGRGHRPARVPHAERAPRRRRHRHRPGARAASASPTASRRCGPRWAAGAGGGRGRQRGGGAVRRGVGVAVLLVRLRQHRAAEPLDHPHRPPARRHARAAPGRDRHRPGRDHGDRPDRRRRARAAGRRRSTLVGARHRADARTPARPRPRARPTSRARRPSAPAAALRAAILRHANAGADARLALDGGAARRSAARADDRARRAAGGRARLRLRRGGELRPADHPARRRRPGRALRGLRLRGAARRARGRPRARHGEAPAHHRRPRRRPGDQPDAGRGPDRGRHRPGHRHGADGGIPARAAPRTCTTT